MEQLELFPELVEPKKVPEGLELPLSIIGLTGYAEAGKSTFAAIAQSLDQRIERLSIAGPLKTRYAAFMGIDEEEIDANKKEHRPALVTFGEEARKKDAEFWLHFLERAFSDIPPTATVIIDDVRHENEAKWIREAGGVIIRVNRVGQLEGSPEDYNECDDIEADFYVWNDPERPQLLEKSIKGILWQDVVQKVVPTELADVAS